MYPQIFVFLNDQKNVLGTQKWIRINYGKRAIGIRAIEVLLYVQYKSKSEKQQLQFDSLCSWGIMKKWTFLLIRWT